MAIVNSEDMKERVFQEFKKQYDKKFKDNSLLNEFFKTYVLDTIKDSDILQELNKNGRDLEKIKPLDYLENESILLRTIRICALLELSKDYIEFKKLNKKIKKDKESIVDIEFERLIQQLIKIQPKSPN
ncbi:hypothetical protein SAMN05421800_11845 [Chryseobacterium balustinum]|uniref:Uncharacterized protein n=2 Tax=Chryseobacterium balustinum TaxID=246 RepID=A0AAX2IJ85_9FLAO|nr:hypothetical protein SAMN05421800_11845 [Chryseobacterium balustinum]SQA88852.1 Uncharacterised protein [Chryseobacterium balustinum]